MSQIVRDSPIQNHAPTAASSVRCSHSVHLPRKSKVWRNRGYMDVLKGNGPADGEPESNEEEGAAQSEDHVQRVVIDRYQPIYGQCCSSTHVKRPCAWVGHSVCSLWIEKETKKQFANQKNLCRFIQISCSLCSFYADLM